MCDQYFGHYLLNKGIITPMQLYKALEYERAVRVKLGILAVNAGLMTAAQVEEVHYLQRVRDKKFGLIAVEQGYLTDEQVEELLSTQRSGHLNLLQAIADKKYMTLTAVEKALVDFRNEYGVEALLELNAVDDDTVIRKCIDFSAARDKSDLLYSYTKLLLRNIVRFLSATPFLLPTAFEDEKSTEWFISQQVIGDETLGIVLSVDTPVLLAIASRFSGEKLGSVNEMALDSVGEFLNVHHGVFCSNLSDAGLRVDLQPQCVEDGFKQRRGQSAYHVPVGTSLGRLDIMLSLKDK
ncbi:hypothetical protein Ga0466249_002548 [Sporomusaceae bacterium BoRhaA]|uniref:chemotaxis protein CheX n=1 Tax=Pelorhabdus rhamnosifermentans TaxID=2772457 RepID=UPI001C060997|nr:chemotaxis protein CheX [Pelorhabdus rhamnosifermentans]MBU2701432.1 hypothetical protein [Pelorhabdus rhamnosifermentans]